MKLPGRLRREWLRARCRGMGKRDIGGWSLRGVMGGRDGREDLRKMEETSDGTVVRARNTGESKKEEEGKSLCARQRGGRYGE